MATNNPMKGAQAGSGCCGHRGPRLGVHIRFPSEARTPVARAPYVDTVTSERTVCDVIIPCRDEAPALPDLLARMPAGFHPIVVDNGSRDATAAVARSLGATVVSEPRAGYGAAVHAGLEAATADYVAVIDGDGSMDPAELVSLLEDVVAGRADLAVGRRRPSAARRLALARSRRQRRRPLVAAPPDRDAVARHRTHAGRSSRGPARPGRGGSPLRLSRRAAAARHGAQWRFVERDIGYHPRAAGTKSKVSGSLLGTMRAARDFARVLS